jgi:hypothetical protein
LTEPVARATIGTRHRMKVASMPFIRFLRLVGIAIGSTVAAWLILSFVTSGMPPSYQPFVGLAVVVLGALIYVDIRRRDRPRA